MDERVKDLACLIDPDAWRAREEDQQTIGACWEFQWRRMQSLDAAQRVAAAGYEREQETTSESRRRGMGRSKGDRVKAWQALPSEEKLRRIVEALDPPRQDEEQ